jgi:hypothetical protein
VWVQLANNNSLTRSAHAALGSCRSCFRTASQTPRTYQHSLLSNDYVEWTRFGREGGRDKKLGVILGLPDVEPLSSYQGESWEMNELSQFDRAKSD